jgi:hypothetical protein
MQTPFEDLEILCPGCVPARQAIRRLRQPLVLAMAAGLLALSGCQPLIVKPAHPSTVYRDYSSHMSEDKRAAISRVAIAPGDTEIEFVAGGSQYGKTGDEVAEGVAAGVDAALSPDGSGEGAIVYILKLPIILSLAAGEAVRGSSFVFRSLFSVVTLILTCTRSSRAISLNRSRSLRISCPLVTIVTG